MMKKYIAGLLILIMIFSLAACTAEEPADLDVNIENPQEEDPIVEEEPEDDSEEDPVVENNSEEIILYFSNNEYIETGNEDLDKVLPEKRNIEYDNIELEEAIVRELIKGPESDKLSTSIPETVKLLNVEVKDKTAFVNFSHEGLNGGSLQEDLTIRQIVDTLIELDTVDKVQFLVDGEESESLMGHFDITEPFEESGE